MTRDNHETRLIKAGTAAIEAHSPRSPGNPTGIYDQDQNTLTEQLVDLRAKGLTYMQIQMETGIEATTAAVRISDYLKKAYSGTSIEEARMLQVRRLEMIMSYLYQQVEAGDFLTQGRHTTNLIATIQQVTELLDLRKDRLRDEQIKLTQEQTGLITIILDEVRASVLNEVMAVLTQRSTYHADTGMRSIDDVAGMRALIERDWGGWFAQAASDALEAAHPDSNVAAGATPARAQHAPSAAAQRVIKGTTVSGSKGGH